MGNNILVCLTWRWFPPHCTQHALLWHEPGWSSPNLEDLTTMPPGGRTKYLVEELKVVKLKLCWHEYFGVFTLNLGRLYWSSSASSSSSVTSILLLKRFGFWLAWLGLNEFCKGACLSDRAGRDFLSLPNTTVSQSFNHLSRQRFVNYKEADTSV